MRCKFLTKPIVVTAIMSATIFVSGSSVAQTRLVRDTATAYGARLNAKGQPANLNQARINNRLASRIDSRIDLRIERYRPGAVADPDAAFRTTMDDKTRTPPVIAPPQQQNADDSTQ